MYRLDDRSARVDTVPPNEVHDSRSAVMAMLEKLSLRLDVIVDLSRRYGHQGVFQIQRSVALLLGGPDVVQTVPTDAAGEVCMKLSRVAVSRAANGRPSVVCCSGFEIKSQGGGYLDLGQRSGEGEVDVAGRHGRVGRAEQSRAEQRHETGCAYWWRP
jgi:acetyl-CoA acetyltransferase